MRRKLHRPTAWNTVELFGKIEGLLDIARQLAGGIQDILSERRELQELAVALLRFELANAAHNAVQLGDGSCALGKSSAEGTSGLGRMPSRL